MHLWLFVLSCATAPSGRRGRSGRPGSRRLESQGSLDTSCLANNSIGWIVSSAPTTPGETVNWSETKGTGVVSTNDYRPLPTPKIGTMDLMTCIAVAINSLS